MFSSKKKQQQQKSRNKLSDTLKGSRFRYLNEKLYTCKSKEALEYFQKNPTDFANYHEGFRQQVSQWPSNPVDVIIQRIRKAAVEKIKEDEEKLIIADMGCGDAKIKLTLEGEATVHAFDLVECKEKGVVAADICNVPLPNDSVDIVVFSLSLMNTNYGDALVEARRILKPQGRLIVAEVESRMKAGPDAFVKEVHKLGYKIRKQQNMRVFMLFDFILHDHSCTKKLSPEKESALKPCLYKKR